MLNKKWNIVVFILAIIYPILLATDTYAQTPLTSDQIPSNSGEDAGSSTPLHALGSPQKIKLASLSFAWNTPTSLASFERNGKVWLIFDDLQQVDVESLKKTAGPLVKNIFQFPHPLATLIQIIPSDGVKISIRKEGLLWIVDLHTEELPPHSFKEMTIFTQYDSFKQPYLFIPNEFSGNVISIIDPEIGDIISTAPSSLPYLGTSQTYQYPEFEILQTIQGLAFVINAPDILLTRSNSGLTLRAQGRGLNISSDLELLKLHQLKKDNADTIKKFNLQIAAKYQKMPFSEAVEAFKKDIISAPANQKNQLRIELARYYIYHGLGTNALFILNQIKNAKLPEAKTDDFNSLRGVANFLARRYQEASSDFSQGKLPDTDEGIFWRTLSQSAYEYNEANNSVIFAHISLIRDYPQNIKDQIALVATENAIHTGDDLSAQNFIDILRSVPDRLRDITPQINYLAAQKLELQGYPRNAIKEYRNLISLPSAKYSALSRYNNAILSQKLEIMPTKEAIAELERLRFAWSEQKFKLNLLDQLASLYLKDFDYYNALRTLNETIIFAKDQNDKDRLTKRMMRVFEEIFLSNQADAKLSPITALALYQDFNWLSELSPRRHSIIQHLADRLVAVDLLPRAYNLLLSLLQESNLTNEDRARIGSRIAIIHLFEKRPHQALDVLEKTDSPTLSLETTNPRKVIQARAYTMLNQTDKALKLLNDDYSKTALLHKFEIYWNGHQWDKAADTVKHLIEEPQTGKPLSQEQINFILDWATTLKQSGKETVLLRLRNKFLPFFTNTKYYSAFNILTKQLKKDKVDINEINTIVNDVKTFTNYAKIYGESLQTQPLE